MQYLGGKARSAREIQTFLHTWHDLPYWEPFLGAAWIGSGIKNTDRVLSDAHLPLISMWRAVQSGWDPPSNVSEMEYAEARALPDTDPRKAFIGFGCSFGGKYFGGYARSGSRNYASNARNSILRKRSGLIGAHIEHADFLACVHVEGFLIYLDPPYANTTGYSLGTFDSSAFWRRATELSRSNIVVVSEYVAPAGWTCVWSKRMHADLRPEGAVERMWIHLDPPAPGS